MSFDISAHADGVVENGSTQPTTTSRFGPKPKHPDDLRTHIATALLTKHESDEVNRLASEMKISVSEFLRRGVNMYIAALGDPEAQ